MHSNRSNTPVNKVYMIIVCIYTVPDNSLYLLIKSEKPARVRLYFISVTDVHVR